MADYKGNADKHGQNGRVCQGLWSGRNASGFDAGEAALLICAGPAYSDLELPLDMQKELKIRFWISPLLNQALRKSIEKIFNRRFIASRRASGDKAVGVDGVMTLRG
jgi:hypothetical protein